jgi:hypothetical protein
MTVEGEGRSALSGGKKAADEALDLVAEYFAPVGGVFTGFFLAGPKLGGAWLISDLVFVGAQKAGHAFSSGQVSQLVGGAVFGSLFIGAGFALWHATRKMKVIGKAVGGFFGGLFGGWGAWALINGIGGNITKGSIDTWVTSQTGQ